MAKILLSVLMIYLAATVGQCNINDRWQRLAKSPRSDDRPRHLGTSQTRDDRKREPSLPRWQLQQQLDLVQRQRGDRTAASSLDKKVLPIKKQRRDYVSHSAVNTVQKRSSSTVIDNGGACDEGRTISCVTGTVMSPGYPQGYYGNDNCTWNIVAEEGMIVEIDFVDFSLPGGDCSAVDHVTIHDIGSAVGTASLYCGHGTLPKFTSVGNRAFVQFTSGQSSTDKGFLFNFNVRDPVPCEDTIELTGNSGVLSSDHYPSNYAPHSDCFWRIVTPDKTRMSLSFDDIALEHARSCEWDGVYVYDGPSRSDDPLLGVFCGRDHSDNDGILSSGNVVLVNLVSDGSGEDRGFQLHWEVAE